MDKRKILINATVSLVAFFALLLGAVSRGGSNIFIARGDYEPYSIVLNTTKNKLATGSINPTGYSGSGLATTELGNAVTFDYSGLINPTSNWQSIKAGGYIMNTQPITGMTGMTLTKNASSADFKIYWSNTTSFTEDKSALFDATSALTVSTSFNGYIPNYIKIYANANSAIKDGVIEFSCSNNYPSLSLSANSSTMGAVTGAGLYAVGQSVTINATANNSGSYFVGWYEGETLISTDASYTFNMPFENTSYIAHFAPNSYNLVLSSESLEKGSVTGGGEYDYLEEVTITATPEMGYSFLGWYNGSSQVSTQSTYTFTMPYNTLNYVAKFSTNNYSIALASEDTNKGTVTGAGTYPYKQSRTITATPKTGYSFVGWYEGETLVSSSGSYTFTMPYTNLSYVAKFSTNSYDLTLTSNDINKGTVSGSGTYAYGAEVTATATEIAGHEFIGWYQDVTLKSTSLVYTFTMPYNALSLEARFVTQYNVDLYSISDPLLGTVSGGGAHGYTTSVTITATPTEGHWFIAWYDDSFNLVSENESYTFTMPEYDVTYYAEFSATKPVRKGDTYHFGTYPQSKVSDSTLLSTLNSARGTLPTSANSQAWTDYGYYISGSVSSYMWYIDITNATEEYRGVYFTSYRPYSTTNTSSTSSSYQDDNGYTTSSVYWFKYEPITWRVLDVQSSSAFLMADLVLDSQDYHYSSSSRTIGGSKVYANNYKESHIRAWLNDNFYNTAFTAAEKARIQTTTVDNSAASTGYIPNQCACANTSDKVFLLSFAEAISATYGLSTTTSRQLQPSAYAQSQGVYIYTSNGNSYWWLRSPSSNDANYARGVSSVGDVNYVNSVYYALNGVVPALWISL